MKTARPITADEIAAYHSAGVVLLKGILDLPTVNALRKSIDIAANSLDQSPNGYDFSALIRAAEMNDMDTLEAKSGGQHDVAAITQYIKSTGKPYLFDEDQGETDGSFIVDTGLASRERSFRRLTISGPVPEIAGKLLNSGQVRFYGDQVFIKEPRTRERTAFHQDATYFEIDGDQCCVLWIPVDPVTLETGAMQYIRGSHRSGKLYQPNVFISQAPLPGAVGDLLPDIEGNMADYDIVHFDVEPGDVIIHHYRTIHGTGGNTSRYQVRRAVSLRYCGDDVRHVSRPWAPKQLHHTHQLADGDPLSGQDFPIVWRRPKAA